MPISRKPSKHHYDIFKEWVKLVGDDNTTNWALILSKMFDTHKDHIAYAVKKVIDWECYYCSQYYYGDHK